MCLECQWDFIYINPDKFSSLSGLHFSYLENEGIRRNSSKFTFNYKIILHLYFFKTARGYTTQHSSS